MTNLNPEQIVHLDYQQYRVTMCNPTYAAVELVADPKQTRVIRLKDFGLWKKKRSSQKTVANE